MQNEILEKIEKEIKRIFFKETSGHDFYHLERVMKLGQTGNYCPPKDSLPKVREILQQAGLSEDKIKKVLHCVEFHEEYPFSIHGQTAKDIETLILQDADRIDALGAIGIARAFAFGGTHHVPIWNPELPSPGADAKYDETQESDPSEIHHFYSKLLHLKDNMNTKTGKKMAGKRHKYMEDYLKEFFKEWEGEI